LRFNELSQFSSEPESVLYQSLHRVPACTRVSRKCRVPGVLNKACPFWLRIKSASPNPVSVSRSECPA
jgi:hypothetical protein